MPISRRIVAAIRTYNLRPRMALFSTDALSVRHDVKNQEFVVEIGKDKAYLAYDTMKSGGVILHHTEVPPVFRGKGVAKILAKSAFDHFVEKDVKMKVTCTYLQKYLEENPNESYNQRLLP